jgi:BlaI family penicillinase repressor
MAEQDKLTPAEWELMEAVWSLGDSPSVREVLEYAFPNGEKAYTTVQTVMNTLERKGFLVRKKTGMVNFYTPVRSRDEMEREEMSSIVSRIFGGSKPALASSLLSLDGLELEELEQIKEILARREKELKEDPK